MCQRDLLFRIRDFTQKIFRPLLSIILSYFPKTLRSTSEIQMISYLSWLVIKCTLDVLGLYRNTPHDKGLIAMRKALHLRKDKRFLTESLIELAECGLKNNILYNLSFYKELRKTVIGTKIDPPYTIIFLGDLEEQFISDCDISPLDLWRYIDDIFVLWQHGEKDFKKLLEILTFYYPTVKFIAN